MNPTSPARPASPIAVTLRPPAAHRVAEQWDRLARATLDPELFDPNSIGDLPEAARRWLTHSIPAGTALSGSVQLNMHGHIRIGKWRSFTAAQVIKPGSGYIWAAKAHVAGLPITGYDRYSSDTGEMRWRLIGAIPLVSADGPDLTRSAAGRLASEIIVTPTAFRSATWTAGDDPDTAVATSHLGHHSQQVILRVHPDGSVRDVVLQRWGNPAGSPFGPYPFGVSVENEAVLGGVTMPSVIRAGWFWGTDRQDEGEFFRATISAATFG